MGRDRWIAGAGSAGCVGHLRAAPHTHGSQRAVGASGGRSAFDTRAFDIGEYDKCTCCAGHRGCVSAGSTARSSRRQRHKIGDSEFSRSKQFEARCLCCATAIYRIGNPYGNDVYILAFTCGFATHSRTTTQRPHGCAGQQRRAW